VARRHAVHRGGMALGKWWGWRNKDQAAPTGTSDTPRTAPSNHAMLELIRTELLPRIPAPGDPARANALMNLGAGLLLAGFEQTGDMAALDEAITFCRQGVKATPEGDPRRATYAEALANLVARRFHKAGNLADLNDAIECCGIALKATDTAPEWNRVRCLAAYGDLVGLRYARVGDPVDLHEAIDAYRDAVEATSSDHPQYTMRLKTLGRTLTIRSGVAGSAEDLDEAVTV